MVKFHLGVRLKLLLKEALEVTDVLNFFVGWSNCLKKLNEYDSPIDHGILKSTNSAGFLRI